MKSKWTRKFLKYNEDGSLRKYYVGLHGEIHEVRGDVDTAYSAPTAYSQIIDGICYLMINELKLDAIEDIYGVNPYSHTGMIIYKEDYTNEEGNEVRYREQLILDPVEEPRVDIVQTTLTPDKHRVEKGCFRHSEPFI